MNGRGNDSLDSGYTDPNSDEGGMEGSKYLQDVLGDILTKALSLCARHRPKDPIQFVADYLYTHNNEHPLVPIRDIENLTSVPSETHKSDDNGDEASEESESEQKKRFRRSRTRRKSLYETDEEVEEEIPRVTPGSEPVQRRSEERFPSSTKASAPLQKRSSSLGPKNRIVSKLPYDLRRFDPKLRKLSMKVPTVALPPDEYKRRRGFKWLPPMKDKPDYDASSAEDDSRYGSRNTSNRRYGQPKRTSVKLEPLSDGGSIDKHLKKSKKNHINNHRVRVS